MTNPVPGSILHDLRLPFATDHPHTSRNFSSWAKDEVRLPEQELEPAQICYSDDGRLLRSAFGLHAFPTTLVRANGGNARAFHIS
jgi:hypothetical protein